MIFQYGRAFHYALRPSPWEYGLSLAALRPSVLASQGIPCGVPQLPRA